MLCETDIKVSWRARPRGFVALMGLYESNYLRFLWLAGEPAKLSGTLISRVEDDCVLQLTVLEHTRYTSALELTYLLRVGGQDQRLPNMRLRAYHDARLLEAESIEAQHKRRSIEARRGERELHQRWTRNMMLNKWLEYCAERGHKFEA
jgi:uncharacterized protein